MAPCAYTGAEVACAGHTIKRATNGRRSEQHRSLEAWMARVLVVDDDEDIRETLRLVLEDAGYDVLLAADGRSALDVLRKGAEGLVVLLDLQMPNVSGVEVLQEIARHK